LYYIKLVKYMEKVYEKAIKLLKIRPHHSEELRKKLLLRGFEQEAIESTIGKLQHEGLLDNERFAQNYLEELLRNKSLGFLGLKVKLLKRGISSSEADQILHDSLSYEDERASAQKLLDKWTNLPKQKIAQRLSSRGYRNQTIRDILRDFC